MKKIICSVAAFLLGISLYSYDIMGNSTIKAGARTVTRTDYSIISKFGEYYRTPSSKFIYLYDESGKQTENSELTVRDVLVNKVVNSYDADARLSERKAYDSEGLQLWNSVLSYKDGLLCDETQYARDGNLKSKTIYTYTDSKLTDESYYNSDGALIWKVVYKYNCAELFRNRINGQLRNIAFCIIFYKFPL